jgi:hypothetical protein
MDLFFLPIIVKFQMLVNKLKIKAQGVRF